VFGLSNADLTLLDILTLAPSWESFFWIKAYINALGYKSSVSLKISRHRKLPLCGKVYGLDLRNVNDKCEGPFIDYRDLRITNLH
jgi:hypothetical protein